MLRKTGLLKNGRRQGQTGPLTLFRNGRKIKIMINFWVYHIICPEYQANIIRSIEINLDLFTMNTNKQEQECSAYFLYDKSTQEPNEKSTKIPNIRSCLAIQGCEKLSGTFTKQDLETCVDKVLPNLSVSQTRFGTDIKTISNDSQIYIASDDRLALKKSDLDACRNFFNDKLSRDTSACLLVKECSKLQKGTFTKKELDSCKVKLFGHSKGTSRFDGLTRRK
jgi:hypothetical protein